MPNEDILFQMASDNFGSREDFDNLLNQEGGKDSIYSIVQDNFGSRKDFDDLYGGSSTDSELGKPMPSVQTNIGGVTEKQPTLKPQSQSPIKSSDMKSLSERLIKTPSSYYTQKITEDITLPQARYVVSSLGYSMEDISNDELSQVLANKESYKSLGQMVDDVKGRIEINRQKIAEQPEQPTQGRVTMTTKTMLGKEVKKEPQVMAPKDPFGFESVIKEVLSPERPASSILQSYDNDQQATIQAEREMMRLKEIYDNPYESQRHGTLKKQDVKKQELASYEKAKKEHERLNRISTKSLNEAMPLIDNYTQKLTDGTSWKSFQNKEGDLDAYKVNDAAKKIAQQNGFAEDGPAVKYIESKIIANANFKRMQPEIEARYAEEQLKISKELKLGQEATAEEFKKVSKTIAETRLQVDALGKEISSLIATDAEPFKKEYETATNDIKTGYDAVSKDLQNQINQNTQLYNSGQITFELAKQQEQQLNAQLDELTSQTNLELTNQFDLLTNNLNAVNSKYKQRFERQQNEIVSAAESNFQKEFEKFAKDKNLTEEAMIKFKAAYKKAYDDTMLADKEKRQQFEQEVGGDFWRIPEFGKFARSIFGLDGEYFETSYLLPINTKVAGIAFENSLGTALEAIGNEMGFEAMRIAGKQMALSTDVLAPKEKVSWSDLGDWISFQKSAGNLAGSMAPSLLATGIATAATGGLGLGAVGAVTIGALAGWQTESMQMASQVYLDTLKETGDAVLAQRRADKMWDFQKSIIFSYGLEALPFIGILKKGVSQMGRRVLLGAAAELGTEAVIQEFPQTIAEEAIMQDKDAMKAVGETFQGLAGYLASRVGGDAPTEQEIKDYQLFKRVLIETAPVALLGGGGQAVSSLREQSTINQAEKIGKEYMQKAAYGSVNPVQSNMFLSQLVSAKGVDFATTMVTGLFTSGQITESEKNKMLDGISKSETIIDTANRQKMNKQESHVFSFLNFLNDDFTRQAEEETDVNVKAALEAKQKSVEADLKNFLITKKSDLFVVEFANGTQTLMTMDQVTTLSENPSFINDLNNGSLSIKGLSAEFTSKQKPIIDDLNARMEASKQAAPEAELTVEEIKQGFQDRLNSIDLASPQAGQLTADLILEYIVMGNAGTVEQAINERKPVDGKEASQLLDSLYAALARVDETPFMTAEQKADIQGLLEPLITKIEGYDNLTEGTTIKVTERQATARPVEDARKVKDQASAIENSRGKKGVLLRPSRRNPNQRVKENVKSIDPDTIPIESEISIVRDDAGEIVGYSFTLPDGNELFVDDPGGGIDLALMQKNEIMGAPPQLMEQVFEDVMREVEVEATTPTTKPKTEENAVQEQTAGQVPVQPEAGVSETMEEGKPEAEPQVVTEEGKAEQAPTEGKKEVRPTDQEMEAGNTELNSANVGDTITTTQPSRIYKGTFGKRNPDGSIRSAHPDVKGSFGSTNRNIALKYKGNESFKAFDIPAGTTIEVVKTPKFSEGISIARQDETDRINNSTAQIVRLDTIDNGGRQSQFIIKDRSLIDNGYLVEEQVPETAQTQEENILTADTKDKTNLQKVYDFLDKLDTDLDNFGRGTAGMNLPIPIVKAIIKAAKALVATGITLEEAIRRAAADNNVSEQDAIDSIRIFTEQANVPPQVPPIIPPPIGTEEREGSTQRVSSIYERMAKKAESEGKVDLAAEIRERGLYTQRPSETVETDSNLLVDTFDGDIEAAADFVMNNPINGDIRTNILGKRMTQAKEAAITNPTPENIAAAEQAIFDFAVYSTDLGQAVNFIKEVEANNPDLFYIGRFAEYIAQQASGLGNPAITITNGGRIADAAKKVKKLRQDILNQVANVIAQMADNTTIDNLMVDALGMDKAGKNRVLTNRMRSGLKKIAASVESKKIISEKLKQLSELGIFGLAETREEVKELIRRGLADVNPSLETPLDTNEIQEMAEMFLIIYEEMASQRMNDLLDKAFNGNNKNNDAIIKAVLYGGLETADAVNKFGQKFGLPYITPQMQQQLRNAAQNVANARGNAARSVAQAAFTSLFNQFKYQASPTSYKIIASMRNFFRYFQSIFYNTALFAINTFHRAAQGNLLRTFGNILNAASRGEFSIIRDSFRDVYGVNKTSFNYTTRAGNVVNVDAKSILALDDMYSSLRGLPRLAEVKRSGGLNEVEIEIRNTDSRLKRRLLRAFAAPASRIMGAIDASVMPLNMFLTKRQAFYAILKDFYKQNGITMKEDDIRSQINDIIGVSPNYVSKAMEQAYVDIVGSNLWTDLGFTSADEFPIVDPRKSSPLSKEAKIYNEFLFRTRELLDSQESKRIQDSFANFGYGSLINSQAADIMSTAVDNYAIKVSSELAFLGTPRGSMAKPATLINDLINTKFGSMAKFAGFAPLFTNAAFNAAGMAIRVTPGLNALQYFKYLYTGTRGSYEKGAKMEFGADYKQMTKIDQEKMFKTVLLTNALFMVAALYKPYDDEEEEKKAIDDKTWTGLTPLKLTKAQVSLGYEPGRFYYKGKGYDYRDTPLAMLFSSIAFMRNFGLWSFDTRSTNFYAEDDGLIGYEPTIMDRIGGYSGFVMASLFELSTIKEMSKTYSELIELCNPPKGEDDVAYDRLANRFLERKGTNFIKTSIPYSRFVTELKTITDAYMDEEKKLPLTFADNIAFGHAIEDNVIKTNGYDFFGRPVKDAFVLVFPFASSYGFNTNPKIDEEHKLYRSKNYTPKLMLNDYLPLHISLDDLNGDKDRFEDLFKRAKKEEKEGGLIQNVERRSLADNKVLISMALSREEANMANEKACKFAGKMVERNMESLKKMDTADFQKAMDAIYNIGRYVAIYQNMEELIEYDRADIYTLIDNKITNFKNEFVPGKYNIVWPTDFEPSSLIGGNYETKIFPTEL